jgi:hypothetical protein
MSVQFFAELGISRGVLPRDLTVAEMSSLINGGPAGMEYEVLVLNQKCQFIDGMCHFYHNLMYPAPRRGEPIKSFCGGSRGAVFSKRAPLVAEGIKSTVWSDDPDYEGHGCHIPWRSAGGVVRHLQRDDWNTPYCAACLLPHLAVAGIGCIKIAGRGFPLEMVVRGVSFFRRVIDLWRCCDDVEHSEETKGKIRELYSQTFNNPCGNRCYYTIQAPRRGEPIGVSPGRFGLIKSFSGVQGAVFQKSPLVAEGIKSPRCVSVKW